MHRYPKLFYYYRASKYLPFYEKDECSSSWWRQETLWPSFTSTLLVFIIIILYHQVFKRNQQLDIYLCKSFSIEYIPLNSQKVISKNWEYFCKSKRNGRCTSHQYTSSASAIDNVICIWNKPRYETVCASEDSMWSGHCNFTEGKQENTETKLQ